MSGRCLTRSAVAVSRTERANFAWFLALLSEEFTMHLFGEPFFRLKIENTSCRSDIHAALIQWTATSISSRSAVTMLSLL